MNATFHCTKILNRYFNDMMDMIQSMNNLSLEQQSSKKGNSQKPLMILGPSAVGKDTLINRLKTKYPDVIYKLPSYTTRPRREGEIQEYNNNYYASNKKKLEEALADKKKIIILNYNIETANAVKDDIDFNFVALLPPSEDELRRRLIKRKTKAEEIEKRMANSIREIQLINEANYINYRLVNDYEERAFNKLESHLKEIYPQLH